jgi:beta-N-acetylhexosaminidase
LTNLLKKWLLGLLLSGLIVLPVHAQSDENILQTMTLQQKVGQMFMVTFFGFPINQDAQNLLVQWQPGAVALLPSNLGNPKQITQLTNSIQQTLLSANSIPAFIAVDQEGGLIAHLKDGFTEFPVPMLWTATNDTDLVYRVGQAMAQEMLAVGINMNLAPVTDVNTNPDNPIIGRRSFGAFPEQIAPIIGAWIRGSQDVGVMATAKHFPGHGDTSQDSHVTLPVINADMERLQRVELVPFVASMQADVGAIMMAHIYFSRLETEPNLPASLSDDVVTGLLREGMGYTGIIMTDAMDMDAIDTVYSPTERALKAITAGNDLILLGAHISPQAQADAMQAVLDAVQNGTLSESRIDSSVRRILTAKAKYGLLAWQPLDPANAETRLMREPHEALITELFAEGITLVYDNADLLPISAGTLFIYPASRPSLWTSCQANGLIPLGVSQSPTDEEIAWAQTSAARANKIVVFTLNADEDEQQRRLVSAFPPEKTILVALQSPYDIETISPTGAYIVTYSPMLIGNTAICDILLGKRLANGKISVRLDR